jgi:hypothetical protein
VTLDALGLVSRNTLILASSKITFSVLQCYQEANLL